MSSLRNSTQLHNLFKENFAKGNYEKWNITIIQINVLKNVENEHSSVTYD